MIQPILPDQEARGAVIAPAGCVPEEKQEVIARGEEVLRAYGVIPVMYPSCYARYGYLGGSDTLRANDIMDAFLDPAIDGIFCLRGGYGVQRLLDKLDFDAIARHPKWFAGYSDITALHMVLNERCHMVTYHTPMPTTELVNGLDAYSQTYLKKAMFGGCIGPLPSAGPTETLRSGKAKGRLCGGNLSLVSSSLGTPYEPDTKGTILFLEDVGEAPYRIDGMINHLRLAGKLEHCAGIVMGYYTDCEPESSVMRLRQIFDDLLPTSVPAFMGYTCGHSRPTMSLPLGAQVEIDADKGLLCVI